MDDSQLKPAGLKEVALWLFGFRKRFKVEGNSMLPLLKPGDIIFIKPESKLNIGNLVLVRHPFQADLKLIKKIERLKGPRVYVKGLNPKVSTDSRHFGPLEKKQILGYISSVL